MDVLELLRELAEGGEATIEVSLRLKREEKQVRVSRPYDTERRIEGYRGIASFLGCSVNYAMKLARERNIRTYTIGRKVYAYEDEVMEDMSADGVKTSTMRGILKRKGYGTERIERVVAV